MSPVARAIAEAQAAGLRLRVQSGQLCYSAPRTSRARDALIVIRRLDLVELVAELSRAAAPCAADPRELLRQGVKTRPHVKKTTRCRQSQRVLPAGDPFLMGFASEGTFMEIQPCRI